MEQVNLIANSQCNQRTSEAAGRRKWEKWKTKLFQVTAIVINADAIVGLISICCCNAITTACDTVVAAESNLVKLVGSVGFSFYFLP